VVTVRRAVVIVLMLSASAAAGERGAHLSASSIQTWVEQNQRVFTLEKDASVATEEGGLSGDAMVVWFDEKPSSKSGAINLKVYSEIRGVGSMTAFTTTGGLFVTDSTLTAYGRPRESALFARARKALAAGDQAADGGRPLAATDVADAANPAAAAASTESTVETGKGEGAAAAAGVGSTASEVAKPESAPAGGVGSTASELAKPEAAPAAPGAKAPEEKAAGGRRPEEKAPLFEMPKLPPGTEPIEVTFTPIHETKPNLETRKEDGTTIYIVTGGVEVGGLGPNKVRAENIVVRIVETPEGKPKEAGVYAEENVRLTLPSVTIDAHSLYYEYPSNRAVMLKAEFYMTLTKEGLPLIMRAQTVRALSGNRFRADNAYVTTCEFGHPDYRMAASTVTVTPIRDAEGNESAMVVAENNRLYIGALPVLWWPRLSRDIKDTHTPLRRFSVGPRSGRFGSYVYTTWDMLDFMGGRSPESWAARVSQWGDLTANVDYREKRGPGTGSDFRYARGKTVGELLTYYIDDRGTDANGFKPSSDNRGRVKWGQRTFYEKYQIDSELSYLSDRGFLTEYYEREAKEDKEQETYVYVKRPWEHAQASFLYRARLNDFQTQTEYLPQGRLEAVGYSLCDGKVVYNSTTLADNVRFSPDEASGEKRFQTQRFDTKHIFDAPIAAPCGLTFTPFATVRESFFDRRVDGGGTDRFAGSYGAKVGLPQIWRVYDAHSALLDVDGLRHIASVDFTYEDVYSSTRRPSELLQFDDVDTVRRMEVLTPALRQRLQTKREGLEPGEPKRIVNLLTLDAEADWFPEPERDNGGREWSDVRINSRMMITDDVSLVADGKYNTYDEEFDKYGLWVNINHWPRTTLALGDRHIRGASSAVLTGMIDHEVTERWRLGTLVQYDADQGRMANSKVVVTRSLHRFAMEFTFGYDRGRRDTTAGINIYAVTGEAGAAATKY